jgi:hypothetical protein
MDDRTDRESIRRIPRWVKVSALVALLLALLVVVMLLIGGGGHGPGRHFGAAADSPSIVEV